MRGDNVSHNDITGDKIITKPSKAYEDNYDAIFRKAKQEALSHMGYTSLSNVAEHLKTMEQGRNA